MNRSSKSAPRTKSRGAELMRELRTRECTKCHYAVDSDGICTNLDCHEPRQVSPSGGALRRTRPELFHGRRWGRWVLDLERFCLVHSGRPTVRIGPDFKPYIAFRGSYECDLEYVRTSARLLDFIFQVRGSIWGIKGGIQDLVNALHDILYPQSSLCSNGIGKTISNPREFLQNRIATSLAKRGAA